jgi:hypothetical protein
MTVQTSFPMRVTLQLDATALSTLFLKCDPTHSTEPLAALAESRPCRSSGTIRNSGLVVTLRTTRFTEDYTCSVKAK